MTHYCEKHQPGGSALLLNLYRTQTSSSVAPTHFPLPAYTLPFVAYANASRRQPQSTHVHSLKEVIPIEILASLEIHRVSVAVGILHGGESCRCSNLFVHGQATCRRVALASGVGLRFCNAKAPLAAIRGVHNHMHHGSNHRRRGRCNNDESYCGLSHFLQVTVI